jgi:sortase A
MNIIIAGLALVLTWIFGGPKIDIGFRTALIVFTIFFLCFLITIFASAIRFLKHKKQEGVSSFQFLPHVRYPVYSAFVFFLNPGLAILSRSWIYFFSCILIYFAWQEFAKKEDRRLTKEFGTEYTTYRLKSALLFPDLYHFSKQLFLVVIGLLVFILSFVALNFASLSFRYIAWDKNPMPANRERLFNFSFKLATTSLSEGLKINNENTGSISTQQISQIAERPIEASKIISNAQNNSIRIEKIGVNAPLVSTASTETSELNRALNQGVVIYPGSAAPGQAGNFFVTAHSSVYPWNRTPYGRAFAKLDKLEAGDRVIINYNTYQYTYQITKKLVLSPKDVHLFGTNEKIITLMTCWPIGTDLQRFVLEGHLIE